MEFQNSQFLKTSVDSGKTWIDSKFFPDSYNQECGEVIRSSSSNDSYLYGLLSDIFTHSPDYDSPKALNTTSLTILLLLNISVQSKI